MRYPVLPALLIAACSASLYAQARPDPRCATSNECAARAGDAIAREQFETAHDLAWRAVQLGPPNDSVLMHLLARTQSLSGRPYDALVMLQRLAARGVRVDDAATSEEFRRVRALPQWSDAIAAIHAAAPTARPPAVSAGAPTSPPRVAERASAMSADGSLAIPSSIVSPIALAHDRVSARFVIADENSSTLQVVDELTGHAVDLVQREWSRPFRTSALAIDTQRGDLWVVGVDGSVSKAPRSAVHKLQLVSGHLLQSLLLPAAIGPAHVVALAVGRDRVFLLDALGHRIFALAVDGKSDPVQVNRAALDAPVSIAAVADNVLYVADAKGVARVDAAAGTVTRVSAAKGANLKALQSLGWHRGSLFAIQRAADGTQTAVRVRLNARGTAATAVETLGPAASSAGAVYGDAFYFVAPQTDKPGITLRASRAR
jgi:hypothetical protein